MRSVLASKRGAVKPVMPLLAKSFDRERHPFGPPSFALLTQHSRDVANVARVLAERYGVVALEAMDVSTALHPTLVRALIACAWLQDIGKSNSHFQEMVGGEPGRSQLLRHETISLLLFSREPLLTWISRLHEIAPIALWSAAGHHRKFDRGITARDDCAPMTLLLSHSDFNAILEQFGRDLVLEPPPTFATDVSIGKSIRDGAEIVAAQAIPSVLDRCERIARMLDTETRKILPVVKAFGIAADVAASALARTTSSEQIGRTARSLLETGTLKSSDIGSLVLAWARQRFPERSIPNMKSVNEDLLRDFQRRVATSDSYLTLAHAGCGAGKSIAAYLWAGEWAKRYENNARAEYRLFFTLPTTGTTTEHFRDYALECGVPAELAHSRAKVDLLSIAETALQEEAPEEAKSADQARCALEAMQNKIEALALWSTPVVVSTSDTVLGLMSNALKPLCSFPAIVSGAIVFDEIHAFDDAMFGHLLVFLQLFRRIPCFS